MEQELEEQKLTIEDLQQQFNALQFFDDKLEAKNEQLWIEARDKDDVRTQLLLEMLFVNKLNTIASNYNWIAQHEYSKFKQTIFKTKITNLNSETDEFGYIKGFGMKMTPEDFNTYEEFYNEIFVTHLIHD